MEGCGDFIENGLKRKGSSFVSENGDSHPTSETLLDDDVPCFKKIRIGDSEETSVVNGHVSELETKGRKSYHDLSASETESQTEDETLEYDKSGIDFPQPSYTSDDKNKGSPNWEGLLGLSRQKDDHVMSPSSADPLSEEKDQKFENKIVDREKALCVGTEGGGCENNVDNEDREELSPTLEASADWLDSPESPDWLQDNFFEIRLTQHASQKSRVQPMESSSVLKELDEANNNSCGFKEKIKETFVPTQLPENTAIAGKISESVKVEHGFVTFVDANGNNVLSQETSLPGTVLANETVSESAPSKSAVVQSKTVLPQLDSSVILTGNITLTTETVTKPDNFKRDTLSVATCNNSTDFIDLTDVEDEIVDSDVRDLNNRDVIVLTDSNEPLVSDQKTSSNVENNALTPVKSFLEQDVTTIVNIVPDVNVDVLLQRLTQRKNDPDRVGVVLNEVLEGQLLRAVQRYEAENTLTIPPTTTTEVQSEDSKPEEQLLSDVEEVKKLVPGVDPNKVFYMLLEAACPAPHRVKHVVAQLNSHNSAYNTGSAVVINNTTITKPVTTQPSSSTAVHTTTTTPSTPALKSSLSDPLLREDKLYADMKTIHQVFPQKDQNEIYAYLEAYHDRSDRVKLVMDELLTGAGSLGSQSQTPPMETQVEVTDAVTHRPAKQHTTTTSVKAPSTSNPVQNGVDHLTLIFPDCDPNYLYQRLENSGTDNIAEFSQKLAAELFEHKNYPKLKDAVEKQAKETLKKKLINLKLDKAEFLTMFPDPVDLFYKEDRAVTETYKAHASAQLMNYFPLLKGTFIKKTLEANHNHFTPTLRALELAAEKYTGRYKNSSKYLKSARVIEQPFPDQPDEFFFKELLYSKHETEIKDYIEEQKRLRAERLERAKANGSLMDCSCCFDDECIIDDMTSCTDGHLFCKECVRRSSEVRIGENKFDFPCLSDGCDHKFRIQTLQTILPHSVFSNVLRKMQEEEIKQADIPDLVSCPFCSFATIMPDPNDRVFKCLNPDCLKESCRLCKEPNHVPLRCDEIEKGGETSMRAFIENRITEAMLRTCWKCKKKFFKIDGCNKMTCTCGATMCYVCREPAIDYGHFNEKTGCAAFTDMNELHRQEMEKAAKEAREKYEQDNPEAAGISLKHDPMKLVEEMRRNQLQAAMRPGFPVPAPGMPVFFHAHNPYDNGEDDYSDEDAYTDDTNSSPSYLSESTEGEGEEEEGDYWGYW